MLDRELYHTALGALYLSHKQIHGEDMTLTEVSQLEQVFEGMLIELDKRGLEIVRKK